jgi:hypothetical protein
MKSINRKTKTMSRLLLESGFTKNEIRQAKANAKLFNLDFIDSVKDVGKRTLRGTVILTVILIIFTIGTTLKNGPPALGIIILMFFMLLIPSYYITPMRFYIKSMWFFIKEKKLNDKAI